MTTAKHDDIVRKIRALLSKTIEAGCTEDEVMKSTELAAKLMAQHQIEMSDTERDEEGFVFTDVAPRFKWQLCVYQWIGNTVANFTGTAAYEAKDPDGSPFIRFYGKQSDAEFADWLCRALADFVVLGLEEYELKTRFSSKMSSKAVRLLRNGYLMGACNRLVARLRALMAATATATLALPGARGLVTLDRQLIAKRKLKEEGIDLGPNRASRRYVDDHSQAAGQARADRAGFGRPVGSAGGPTALIGKG